MQAVQTNHRYLIVVDHREARIYKSAQINAQAQNIHLHAHGEHRYLHSVTRDDNGRRTKEYEPFYAKVMNALKDADQIVVFGHGQGGSSAMDHLLTDLKKLHPKVAARVIATQNLDIIHLTEPQLLAIARDVYEKFDLTHAEAPAKAQ